MIAWVASTPLEREQRVHQWISELGVELGRELHISDARGLRVHAAGFSIHVRDVGQSLDRVRAIVGAQDVDGELYVRSWVFYYLSGRRVAPPDSDFAEYEIRSPNDTWRFHSWQPDEHDEFEPFATYD